MHGWKNTASNSDAFAAFVAKKTTAAIQAAPAPYVTSLVTPPAEHFQPIATPWSDAIFGGPFYVRDVADSILPTCSLVFVRSANGNTGAHNPALLGGGATD